MNSILSKFEDLSPPLHPPPPSRATAHIRLSSLYGTESVLLHHLFINTLTAMIVRNTYTGFVPNCPISPVLFICLSWP
jgi:hypothetical protein